MPCPVCHDSQRNLDPNLLRLRWNEVAARHGNPFGLTFEAVLEFHVNVFHYNRAYHMQTFGAPLTPYCGLCHEIATPRPPSPVVRQPSAKEIHEKREREARERYICENTPKWRDLAQQATVSISRGVEATRKFVEDLNFGAEERVRLSGACSREDRAELAKCLDAIDYEKLDEDVFDAGLDAILGKIFGLSDSKAVLLSVGKSAIKVARNAVNNPNCQAAIANWNAQACMKRVLPTGVVSVRSYPKIKISDHYSILRLHCIVLGDMRGHAKPNTSRPPGQNHCCLQPGADLQ